MPSPNDGPVKARYDKMATDRNWYLTEGMDSASLTIPSIMPSDQDATNLAQSSPVDMPKPWQSIGAKGVRNLASKLGLTLFPPTGAFIRYQLAPEFKLALEQEGREAQRTDIEAKLAVREQTIMDDIEANNVRTKADQALRQLIVVGNVLTYLPPDGGMRVFPLNNYVVRRDFVGNVVELIYVEMLDKSILPENVREALVSGGADAVDGELVCKSNKVESVALYTRLKLTQNRKKYMVEQEADGNAIDLEGKTSIKRKKFPYMALRFVTIDGEDYGRGYVEEYRGDLRSAEELRKSIVIGALNAAKVVALVAPGAAVTPKKLMEAENGAALLGRAEDVTMMQQNKHADMRVAQQTYQDLRQDLGAAFLLTSAYQRDAERVTAEEVRRMAEELEDALGGIYSVLAQEMQLPIALRTEDRLIKSGAIKEITPDDVVRPIVVTGLAAIGRGHEFNRLREFAAFIRNEVQPLVPEIGNYFVARDLLDRAAIGLGVPTEGLVKDEETMAAEAAKAQQDQMRATLLEGGAPALAEAAAGEMTSQMGDASGQEEG
jgi:hypothetical protein